MKRLLNGVCIKPELVTYISRIHTPSGRTANVECFYICYEGKEITFFNGDTDLYKLKSEIENLCIK